MIRVQRKQAMVGDAVTACSHSTEEMRYDVGKCAITGTRPWKLISDRMHEFKSRVALIVKETCQSLKAETMLQSGMLTMKPENHQFFRMKISLITHWLHSLNSALRQRGAVASVRLLLLYQYCLTFHSPKPDCCLDFFASLNFIS